VPPLIHATRVKTRDYQHWTPKIGSLSIALSLNVAISQYRRLLSMCRPREQGGSTLREPPQQPFAPRNRTYPPSASHRLILKSGEVTKHLLAAEIRGSTCRLPPVHELVPWLTGRSEVVVHLTSFEMVYLCSIPQHVLPCTGTANPAVTILHEVLGQHMTDISTAHRMSTDDQVAPCLDLPNRRASARPHCRF
jgi:hypothetical protein